MHNEFYKRNTSGKKSFWATSYFAQSICPLLLRASYSLTNVRLGESGELALGY